MSHSNPAGGLQVDTLLNRSAPRHPLIPLAYAGGMLLVTLLAALYLTSLAEAGQAEMGLVGNAVLLVGVIAVGGYLFWQGRAQRVELQNLQSIEELIHLRRWPQAGELLNEVMSKPMRGQTQRIQAVVFLASVLSRHDRHADAIHVYDALLDSLHPEEPTSHVLKLGRAMSMLRDDRLSDADRAINELRRNPGDLRGGVTLIEMYRDVKTGHPAEAVELYETRYAELRDALGQRVGEAAVLAAWAYHYTNQPERAQAAFENATLLTPFEELARRYPEVRPLASHLRSAEMPGGSR